MSNKKITRLYFKKGLYKPSHLKAGSGFAFFWKPIFNLCYFFGLMVLNLFIGTVKFLDWERRRFLHSARLRSKEFFKLKFVANFSLFILVSFALLGALKFFGLAAYGLSVKDRLKEKAVLGISQTSIAGKNLSNLDSVNAQKSFYKAVQTFSSAENDLKQASKDSKKIFDLTPQSKTAENLLYASKTLAGAGYESSQILEQISKIKVTPGGVYSEPTLPEIFAKIEPSFQKIQAYFIAADLSLSKVNVGFLPKNQQDLFLKVKFITAQASEDFKNLNLLFGLTRQILTGKKHILILFLNNNELRPGGGFIGTYGKFLIEDGQIKQQKISSIYDLDGQLTEEIFPPHPLYNVNNRWFLRDSNWFFDFPSNAKKAISFYEKEGNETPDLLIAMTPELVKDLLNLTGTVSIRSQNVDIDAENFSEQIEAQSTLSQDKAENLPKQILADLFPILLEKISTLSVSEKLLALESYQKQTAGKQIMFYSPNQQMQNTFKEFGWDGSVHTTDRDFLGVATANLGGTKTDLHIAQNLELETEFLEDGSIVNNLKITRKNNLPNLEYAFNLSFIRVFVPENSELISISGFDYKNIGEMPRDNAFKSDSDILAWEKSAVKDVLTGTLIGKEANKTYFGNWMNLKGGESKSINIKYKLPFKLALTDRFTLLWQKQPGAQKQTLSYAVKFPGKTIEWMNFKPQKLDSSFLSFETEEESDKFFGIIFSSK